MPYGKETVGTSASELVANSNNSRRIGLLIKNLDSTETVYIGDDNSVTTSNGYPIEPGETFVMSFDGAIANFFYRGSIWIIAGSAGIDVRYFEFTEKGSRT